MIGIVMLAIMLSLMAMILLGIQAVIAGVQTGDWVFLSMWVPGIIAYAAVIYHFCQMLKRAGYKIG